jgi:hypothetical protein
MKRPNSRRTKSPSELLGARRVTITALKVNTSPKGTAIKRSVFLVFTVNFYTISRRASLSINFF